MQSPLQQSSCYSSPFHFSLLSVCNEQSLPLYELAHSPGPNLMLASWPKLANLHQHMPSIAATVLTVPMQTILYTTQSILLTVSIETKSKTSGRPV